MRARRTRFSRSQPFREAKDTRSKQTTERLDAWRETSDVCVCPEKGAGQT